MAATSLSLRKVAGSNSNLGVRPGVKRALGMEWAGRAHTPTRAPLALGGYHFGLTVDHAHSALISKWDHDPKLFMSHEQPA